MKFKVGDKVKVILPRDLDEERERNSSIPFWNSDMNTMAGCYCIAEISNFGYYKIDHWLFREEWLELAEEVLYEI